MWDHIRRVTARHGANFPRPLLRLKVTARHGANFPRPLLRLKVTARHGANFPQLPHPTASDSAPHAAEMSSRIPEGHDWAQEAELAVTRARTVDTPESWREAVHAALVFTDKVQAMLAVADARQAAEQMAQAAQVTAEAAGEAKRTAEQTDHAAREATQAARVAAEAAADAKQRADLAAEAVPQAAQVAQVAAEAAAEAKRNALELERIVANAREANTPEAWREAVDVAPRGGDSSDQRHPDSMRANSDRLAPRPGYEAEA